MDVPRLWDDSLYAGSAEHYLVGRLPYPEQLATVLHRRSGLEGGRLLDLGCGPGALTLLLAPRFTEVVAVDADPDMVRVAAREADRRGIANVRWIHSYAEDLRLGEHSFDVATLAQSFHWLEQERVGRALHGMLEPGGALVHVGATTHEGDGDVPRAEIDALIRRYLGDRPEPRSDERLTLGTVGFDDPVELEIERTDVFERDEDDVVASVFSLSYAAPARFGDRRDAFERDLRELLGGRTFRERPRAITLLVYRRS